MVWYNTDMPVITTNIPEGYISGQVRDYPHKDICHLYKGSHSDPGLPMCQHGWNRREYGYSIWRGAHNRYVPVCKVCLRRARSGLEGVENKYESRDGE